LKDLRKRITAQSSAYIARTLDKAVRANDSKKLYSIAGKVSGKKNSSTIRAARDKNGVLFTKTKKILEINTDFWEELLRAEGLEDIPVFDSSFTQLDCVVE